jgi:hypothetical protein
VPQADAALAQAGRDKVIGMHGTRLAPFESNVVPGRPGSNCRRGHPQHGNAAVGVITGTSPWALSTEAGLAEESRRSVAAVGSPTRVRRREALSTGWPGHPGVSTAAVGVITGAPSTTGIAKPSPERAIDSCESAAVARFSTPGKRMTGSLLRRGLEGPAQTFPAPADYPDDNFAPHPDRVDRAHRSKLCLSYLTKIY